MVSPFARPSPVAQAGYDDYDREAWPGGGVLPVGLTNPGAITDYTDSFAFNGYTGTIENKRFSNGTITVDNASRITFRNCEFVDVESKVNCINTGPPDYTYTDITSWALYEDCLFRKSARYEWLGEPNGDEYTAFTGSGIVCRRCEFKWVTRMATLFTPQPTTAWGDITEAEFDSCWHYGSSSCCEGHRTSFYFIGGVDDVNIHDCWIENPWTHSGTIRFYDVSNPSNIVLNHNVVGGQGGYCIGPNSWGGPTITNNYILSWYPLEGGWGEESGPMDVPRTLHCGGWNGTWEGGGSATITGNKWWRADGVRTQGGDADSGDLGTSPQPGEQW